MYQCLAIQSGSVTGLTKDGQVVASSKYQLYGATQSSTGETSNPYAYNGEPRDSTGLDYLRARYYDSQAGTFLTEDSYQGELDDPLSQNRYAYGHNNPVNYTDPSGHFRKMLPDGKGPRYTQPKPLINPKDGTLYAPTTPEHEAHQIRQQQTGVYSYTYVPSYVPTSSAYEYIQQQESQLRAQAYAQAVQYRQQQIRQEYAQSIGQYGRPKAREANNLLLNWSKALNDMFTHVCDPKTTKAKDKGRSPKPISFGGGGVASWEGTAGPSSRYQPNASDGTRRDSRTNEQILADHQWKWNATVNALKILGGELSGLYNAKRLWTGKD
ncbi:RHS repeat-associated core domain-containing protein, partial [Streptococcus azizii]